MAVKKNKKYIVSTMRDIDQSPVYVCVNGVDGNTISTKVPLDVEVLLDENVVKSIKNKTEMVRVKAKGKGKTGEELISKPTYSVTPV